MLEISPPTVNENSNSEPKAKQRWVEGGIFHPLFLRFFVATVFWFAAIVFGSVQHMCLLGYKTAERVAPFVVATLVALSVLLVRRYRLGVPLAFAIFCLFGFVIYPAYSAWIHGPNGPRFPNAPSPEEILDRATIIEGSKSKADSRPMEGLKQWPYVKYAKAVGYYFPSAGRGDTGTVLKHGGDGLDEENLRSVKEQEKALDASQITRLFKASFESKFQFSRASCYDAHHIFVFYDEQENAVAACEVCLKCKARTEWPENKSISHEYHQAVDFVGLARLCSELGLKPGPAYQVTHGPMIGQMKEPTWDGVIEVMLQQQESIK